MIKELLKRLTDHITLIILLILLQIVLFVWMVNYAASYWQWNLIFLSLSGISVFILIAKDENPAYKLLWIIPILLFPVFGGAFYLFYKQRNFSTKQIKRHLTIEEARKKYVEHLTPAIDSKESVYLFGQHWPSYQGTKTTFLDSGETMLAKFIEDIDRAEKFILIDFFVIKKGKMWDTILQHLKARIEVGVEVIVLYDDVGSVGLPRNYPKKLWKNYQIKAYQFNRIRLRLNFSNNYRSHRKVVVIDGKVGYSTGNNIGDEYINLIQPFGHWSDAGIRIEGKAVWSLTLTFFNTLEFVNNQKTDYEKYYVDYSKEDDGYVIPFADTPLDKEETTKTIYLSLIYSAKKSLKITTPYLIIDHEFKNALQYAAKAGVEVEIIIPKIPDKKFVYMVTESNVPLLLKSGVKVYRYTPGFIHSKMMIVDGEVAMIGTANLDYRSLYLHFENSVYLAHSSAIKDMDSDFEKTRKVSALILENEEHSFLYRVFQVFFKMFSGLL